MNQIIGFGPGVKSPALLLRCHALRTIGTKPEQIILKLDVAKAKGFVIVQNRRTGMNHIVANDLMVPQPIAKGFDLIRNFCSAK